MTTEEIYAIICRGHHPDVHWTDLELAEAIARAVETENAQLREALEAMKNPPLILASDDATEVARWYDVRICELLAAHNRGEG